MSSSSSLINGKHYKLVVLDHYDDIINELDIYAEESLKKFKNDDDFNKNEEKESLEILKDRDYLHLECYRQIKMQNVDDKTASAGDVVVISNGDGKFFQDFVHCERMRAIEEMKKLQKNRLEELKSSIESTRPPNSIEEALFGVGTKFGFLIKIAQCQFVGMGIKFRGLAVVVDFYLDKLQIELIE